MATPHKRPLLLLAAASTALLVPALLAWLVNIETAIQAFRPDWTPLGALFPRMAGAFAITALDLSTVTTFVPLLMLLFPIVQSIRIVRRVDADPAFAHQLDADPYPPHFGFFLVMLGLAGTLYGLLICLNISGVSSLAESAPSANSIRTSLDRLLAGTATALLSSLVGLIGAFLSAKPIPWFFRKLAGIEADESRRTLSETVERLTEDLRGLSQASRVFASRLRPEALDGLFSRFDRQEAAVESLQEDVKKTVAVLERIETEQKQTNQALQKLDSLNDDVRAAVQKAEATNQHLDGLLRLQEQTNALIETLNADGDARHRENIDTIRALADASSASQKALQRNQDALRKALAAYAASE